MSSNDWGLLAIRIVVGVIMLMHAYNHLFLGGKIAGTGRWFESLGLRPGPVQAWASVFTEVAAGAGLILGLFTPLAAAAAIGPMTVAGLVAHRKNGFFVFKDGYEYVLMIAVVAAAVALIGPGAASIDDALDIVIRGPLGGAIAVVGGVGGSLLLLAATWRPNRKPAETPAAETPTAETPATEAPAEPA